MLPICFRDRGPAPVPLFLFVLLGLTLGSARADDVSPIATVPPSLPTAGATSSTAPTAPPKTPTVENSVVKIFSTVRYPDPFRPWTKQPPQEITGSGVVIEGRRILTNAHVISYASQVQIQASQSGDKLSATVVAVAPGIDLAVLSLENEESFYSAHPPLQRANVLPEIKDAVLAYGFPTGGTSLSITKGIVSRIEFSGYNNFVSGLRIQIDAAINPGNSGGPAIADNKMIGLAFSTLNNAQNIGYIIPNEEIDLFLADIADGKYDGKAGFYDETQKMQNPALRPFLHLGRETRGTIIHSVFSDAPGYPLKKWDVITHIGDAAVDDEGMVELRPDLRVRFEYMIQKVARHGAIPLTIVRDGREQHVEVPVSAARPAVINDLQGSYPPFFIYGPLVFSIATTQFVGGINRDSFDGLTYTGSPLLRRRGDKPSSPDEQIVIVSSPFLPHRLANTYWPPTGWTVTTINEVPVRNLAGLVATLRDLKSEFVTLEFSGRGMESMVFPRKEMLAATEEILTDNGIRAQGSPDTLEVWNAKPTK